jgi:hypothetical protein
VTAETHAFPCFLSNMLELGRRTPVLQSERRNKCCTGMTRTLHSFPGAILRRRLRRLRLRTETIILGTSGFS